MVHQCQRHHLDDSVLLLFFCTSPVISQLFFLVTQRVVPAAVPADIPKAVQGQQVILAPGGGGLGTVALSQILLPGTTQMANAANSQPIYFTTQGLPVQNIHPVQPGQSPMSLVLNVQQGQTVRPITLVQAPGTQIFKPAVGATQIITQPAQIRTGAPVANRVQTPSTFSTMQIPATLTIRTTTAVAPPAASSLPTMSSTTITQPSAARTTTKICKMLLLTIPITHTTASTTTHLCPRCGAQFKMIEALRSHMCFCCPDLAQTDTNSTATAVSTPATPPKSLSVVPSIKQDSPPTKAGDTQNRLVMLVDDFYYGTFEGNRVYVPMDNSKEPLSFKCLTCNKRLKNNIRLMNHMKYHVELEQQNGEMDTHTSCQHCFRRFPTPFRLQCHLESVHTAIESSTKCKICEWSFESEPVFLQHMKNTHKPGEMPYVCQVCEYRSSFYSDVFNHFRTWHEDTRHLLCQYCLKVFKHSTSYQQHYNRHQKSTVYHCNKCRLQFLFTKDKVEHKINHHRTFRKPCELEGLQPGTKVTIRAYVGLKKSPGQKFEGCTFGLPLSRALMGRHKCVECTFDIPDFANHYPTYVHCSLCFYSTCCSRAYANHMINNHVPGRVPKTSKKGPPSGVKLSCAGCEYSTALGNLMAKHLIKFPSHSYSPDVQPTWRAGSRHQLAASLLVSCQLEHHQLFHCPTGDPQRQSTWVASRGAFLPDVDQEMAPLEDEDTDSDSEKTESDEDMPHETAARQEVEVTVTNTLTPPVKNREETLSIHQRRILLLALCSGVQKAAKEMDTKHQLIKTWLQDKEDQLNECSSTSCGEAVDRLVEWVLTQREQQRPINEAKLFEKASELQSQTNEINSFRISYEWAVSFMILHKLGLDTPFTVDRELPNAMEENCRHYTELVHSKIKTNNIPQCVFGAMDQLSVFVDFKILNENTRINRETAFQFTGFGKPFIKIYLSMLANGTMLPAVLFTSQSTNALSKSPPDSILLMAKEEGFSAAEELEIWATKVWKQHLDSQNENDALLVMDSHHSQTSESIISTVSSNRTFPAIVPAGCTGRHQPLEMCVRPVLQRLLLARWAQQPINCASGVQRKDLVELLISWLEEAMSCFSGRPEFIQHSFCMARLLPDQEAHTNLPGSPLELLNMLSAATLETEVVDLDSEEEEPMDAHTVDKVSQVTEKIDLTQEPEDEVSQTKDEDVMPIEIKNTEQQKKRTDECLEIASESTDVSHSSPESETHSHNSEQDQFSESGQDANAYQTDSANR
uniref:Pogo transposable element derived with ZNF domain b n=1 Tax=Cyprinus carpio carpio TaxID=630221 RepID=A0A9J8BV92_CYPCA